MYSIFFSTRSLSHADEQHRMWVMDLFLYVADVLLVRRDICLSKGVVTFDRGQNVGHIDFTRRLAQSQNMQIFTRIWQTKGLEKSREPVKPAFYIRDFAKVFIKLNAGLVSNWCWSIPRLLHGPSPFGRALTIPCTTITAGKFAAVVMCKETVEVSNLLLTWLCQEQTYMLSTRLNTFSAQPYYLSRWVLATILRFSSNPPV